MTAKREGKPKPVSGAIDSVIGSLGLTTSHNGWLVVNRWAEIVGDQIAKRSKAVRFDDGILYVVVEDSSWRQNLALQMDDLMAAIKRYPCGKVVKQVRFIGSERGH